MEFRIECMSVDGESLISLPATEHNLSQLSLWEPDDGLLEVEYSDGSTGLINPLAFSEFYQVKKNEP